MRYDEVILKRIVTEKTASKDSGELYCFAINKNANKHTVKHAVEDLFDVRVEKVTTSLYKIKSKSKVARAKSQLGKKAFVKLRQGQKIDKFSAI